MSYAPLDQARIKALAVAMSNMATYHKYTLAEFVAACYLGFEAGKVELKSKGVELQALPILKPN
jgi:hypothetical protein